MSVVKQTLRQQDASFISLREVLELLTRDGEGSTLAEAASYLLHKLTERDAPELMRRDPVTRALSRSIPSVSRALLEKVINPVDVDDDVPF